MTGIERRTIKGIEAVRVVVTMLPAERQAALALAQGEEITLSELVRRALQLWAQASEQAA